MESIIIYPKDDRQKSLLKDLLEELKVHFEIEDNNDTLFSSDEFYSKIDHSIQQAEDGKTQKLTKDEQKELLGL